MRKKILFRADGEANIGLGHLYRLFAVVEMLKSEFDFCFLTKETSTISVIPEDYPLRLIPKDVSIEAEPQWLAAHFPTTEFFVIADGYAFDSQYQKRLKNLKYYLVYIDDLVEGHYYADIVINHSPSLKPSDFDSESYTRFGLGTKYALLRPSFLARAKEDRPLTPFKEIFICFGGADKLNLSLMAVKACLSLPTLDQVHVVLGGAYTHTDILTLQKKFPEKLHVYRNLSERELVNLMISCNLAVVPTSTIFYELCCIRMPILGGYFVDNQKTIYESMAVRKVLIQGGDFTSYTIEDFKDRIQGILEDRESHAFIARQKSLFDGRSSKRIAGLINAMTLRFRRAMKKDLATTFKWSNDVLVRSNSFDSEPISLEQHTKWFLGKIANNATLFLIALVNETPAGVVRYELNEEHAVIGISISKNYRGQNLAHAMLKKSASRYFETNSLPILAYIKEENIASEKSFKKAGYTYLKTEEVKGNKSNIYKLECKNEI